MGDRGMPDREKVIRGLEVCTVNGTSCNGCPYYGQVETIGCVNSIMEDALALLREQEPVKWIRIHPAQIYECSGCGQHVMTGDIKAYKYCHGCGRKVKWDATT